MVGNNKGNLASDDGHTLQSLHEHGRVLCATIQAFGDGPASVVVLLGHQLFGVVEPVVGVGVVAALNRSKVK